MSKTEEILMKFDFAKKISDFNIKLECVANLCNYVFTAKNKGEDVSDQEKEAVKTELRKAELLLEEIL